MAKGRFVAYYRVSTDKQGKSGLGLEAQKDAVSRYLNGGSWELVGEFEEIESGGKDDRPQLTRAMQAARLRNATLIIAKLDRLSRDAAFLLGLQKAGVDFVAADMPDANKMTVGVMALVAQHEREAISARTLAALQAAKARGIKLGTHRAGAPVLSLEAIAKGRAVSKSRRSQKAAERAADLLPLIQEFQQSGHTSLRQIALKLNAAGYLTTRGGQWSAVQVDRVLKRCQPLS
jgi:DNA invertase Pin-like site-specific DNA recombinase